MQRSSPLQKAYGTSSTSSAFTSIIPTTTEPVGVNPGEVGSGIFNLYPGAFPCCKVPEFINLGFFGAGADNDTFDVRLWGWDRVALSGSPTLWVPRPLASFTCTLSTTVGIAGAPVINTDRIVDTLVVHTIAPQPFYPGVNATPAAEYIGTVRIMSGANQLMAWAIVPLCGSEKIQFDIDLTGTTTSANALFRFLNCYD